MYIRQQLTLLRCMFVVLLIAAIILTSIIRTAQHQHGHSPRDPYRYQLYLGEADRSGIFLQRREHVQHVCQRRRTSYNVTKDVSRYFSFSPRHRLVYCSIQKVGCSFWLRVMKILRGELPPGSLLNGSFRHQTGERGRFGFWRKPTWFQKRILKSYKKFLFVRDPYSRLFSGYMDKVFLPTRRIFKVLSAFDVNNVFVRNGSKEQCFTNISFKTFVEALVSGRLSDGHFSPMYQHCDPCKVKFEFIGRMESFNSDAEFILKQTGTSLADLSRPEKYQFDSDIVPHYLDARSLRSQTDTILNSHQARDIKNTSEDISHHPSADLSKIKTDLILISDLVKDAFRLLRQRGHCHSSYFCEIFSRVWRILQTRGLISANTTFDSPSNDCKNVSKSELINYLTHAYFQSGSREERVHQREDAMLEAFYTLPRSLLKRVEKYVRKDCELFGYECSVDVRFPVRGLYDDLGYYLLFTRFWQTKSVTH